MTVTTNVTPDNQPATKTGFGTESSTLNGWTLNSSAPDWFMNLESVEVNDQTYSVELDHAGTLQESGELTLALPSTIVSGHQVRLSIDIKHDFASGVLISISANSSGGQTLIFDSNFGSGSWGTKTATVTLTSNMTDIFIAIQGNAVGSWQAWIDTISVEDIQLNQAPTVPTSLQVNSLVNNIQIPTLTPSFTAIFNDPDGAGEIASAYQIQVSTDPTFAVVDKWDSTKNATGAIAEGDRIGPKTFAGSGLVVNTLYYWRIRLWDDEDEVSPYSTEDAYFAVLLTVTEGLIYVIIHSSPPIVYHQRKDRFTISDNLAYPFLKNVGDQRTAVSLFGGDQNANLPVTLELNAKSLSLMGDIPFRKKVEMWNTKKSTTKARFTGTFSEVTTKNDIVFIIEA